MNSKLILIIFTASLLIFTACSVQSSGKYDDFAKCLTSRNVSMYGAYWCPHCAAQKKAFGSSFKYVSYVECSLPNNAGQTQICIDAGIQSYPTWDFNGKKVEGEEAFSDLVENSGCSVDLIKN